VASIGQLGDEPGADCAARAYQENSHHMLLTGHIRGISRVCL
jgi:hypothetical protein